LSVETKDYPDNGSIDSVDYESDQEIDNSESIVYAPRRIGALSGTFVIQVTCGDRFTAALTREGQLFSWGANDYGQLGVGDDEERDQPTSVEWMQNVVVKAIAAGGEFMAAIIGNDQVYSWGRGAEGQLGVGYEVYDEPQCSPLPVNGISAPVVTIAAGGTHSAAVTKQGEMYTWGNGKYGQLGHGDTESLFKPRLVRELARSGEDEHIISVACGAQHTLALTSSRAIYSWGSGEGGLLGYGIGNKISCVPTIVSALAGYSVQSIGCTAFGSFAIIEGRNNS